MGKNGSRRLETCRGLCQVFPGLIQVPWAEVALEEALARVLDSAWSFKTV